MSDTLKKILIVEDEEMIAKPLGMKLRLSGFETKHVLNGKEALDTLAQEKFGVILLDLLMPEVDGFAVLAELQKRNDSTPVIVATNLNQAEDVSRVFELGCTNYYVKADTTLDQIVENVKKTIR